MIQAITPPIISAEKTIAELRSFGNAYLLRSIMDVDEAFRCASLLLMHVLDMTSYSELVIRSREHVSPAVIEHYNALLTRKANGEPVQYITGHAPFMDLILCVTPGCLIPRPETELLVERVIGHLKRVPGTPVVLDIGTGSGNIAIALAHYLKNVRIDAIDISAIALEIAHQNACNYGVQHVISFYKSFLFNAVPSEKQYTVIVSNPPYVAEAELNALQHELSFEPHEALIAGRDGLATLEEIIESAYARLEDDGALLLEIGSRHGKRVEKLLKNKGYCNVAIIKDHAQHDRIAFGQKRE
ncbi:MAG: peptide chain release factor N(5)-glutamine methyltransferase [Candidatus Omnitrophica bacterium]|nr:peptide chain release factor N(5)-glutamine methyltransferase [Candidatus Omnitrophota bacterium]